jgi:hypothetical protein
MQPGERLTRIEALRFGLIGGLGVSLIYLTLFEMASLVTNEELKQVNSAGYFLSDARRVLIFWLPLLCIASGYMLVYYVQKTLQRITLERAGGYVPNKDAVQWRLSVGYLLILGDLPLIAALYVFVLEVAQLAHPVSLPVVIVLFALSVPCAIIARVWRRRIEYRDVTVIYEQVFNEGPGREALHEGVVAGLVAALGDIPLAPVVFVYFLGVWRPDPYLEDLCPGISSSLDYVLYVSFVISGAAIIMLRRYRANVSHLFRKRAEQQRLLND